MGTVFYFHGSSCTMIGSTVKVFFFMPYLRTSSSDSLWLTISWTNSAWKYVISSIIHIKQHTVQKPSRKTETAVNFVKTNRKPQVFLQNQTDVIFANRTLSSSCVIFLCRRLTCYGPPCLTPLEILKMSAAENAEQWEQLY